MRGYRFSEFTPQEGKSPFEKLLDIFLQMMNITSGNVGETLDWMHDLDRQYKLTTADYGMADFIEDLKKNGYINEGENGGLQMTSKSEQKIRQKSLEDVFGKIKKSKQGNHKTPFTGIGDETSADMRSFQFGDALDQISMTESIKNAQINHGISEFSLAEGDLEIMEKEQKSQTSTVLMIDISHSMILYGEDRITPAKKVAMALAELVRTRYPKDTLDIVVFGDDAWQVTVKDLPYLQVGPFHTNTVAGLELSMELLRRRKNKNKQIFMITDGKPTCLKEGINYYKNSWGLDRKVINKTLTYAAQCRKLSIPITTFMIASDPYLKQFVHEFTEVNNGKAYYSSLDGLGSFIFEDFQNNRRKTV
ncbi:MAG: vWA domain-containing protein [Cytophagales bacterium]